MSAVVFFETLEVTFPPAVSMAAVASSRRPAGKSPRQDENLPGQRTIARQRGLTLSHTDAGRLEFREQLPARGG